MSIDFEAIVYFLMERYSLFWVVYEIYIEEFEILSIGSQCVYIHVHAFELVVKGYNSEALFCPPLYEFLF